MAWRTDEGSGVSPGQCFCTQVCGCNGCCAWLWLWTGWSPSIFYPDLAPSDYFLFPNMKKTTTWLGSSIGSIMRSYLQLRTFSRIRMRVSIPHESKRCNTDGRSVWTAGETTFGQTLPLHHRQPMNFSAHPCNIISIFIININNGKICRQVDIQMTKGKQIIIQIWDHSKAMLLKCIGSTKCNL